jgi:hypothetical protein
MSSLMELVGFKLVGSLDSDEYTAGRLASSGGLKAQFEPGFGAVYAALRRATSAWNRGSSVAKAAATLGLARMRSR